MPLNRKTPLVQRTPLNRTGGLNRGSGLKPRSDRRAREYAQPGGRRDLVVQALTAWPRCQACWACAGAPAVDVHERLTRARGGSILDLSQSHAITVCRRCHDLIGREIAQATARRLLLPSWHRCPPGGIGPC